jgi:hypothetical protein
LVISGTCSRLGNRRSGRPSCGGEQGIRGVPFYDRPGFTSER